MSFVCQTRRSNQFVSRPYPDHWKQGERVSCAAMESYFRDITREQLSVVNSQSLPIQTLYPSSTLTSSQSDLLNPQDYRTAVLSTDINRTKFA